MATLSPKTSGLRGFGVTLLLGTLIILGPVLLLLVTQSMPPLRLLPVGNDLNLDGLFAWAPHVTQVLVALVLGFVLARRACGRKASFALPCLAALVLPVGLSLWQAPNVSSGVGCNQEVINSGNLDVLFSIRVIAELYRLLGGAFAAVAALIAVAMAVAIDGRHSFDRV